MRNSRKRGTLPRAESQKRLNRDGPNPSRFDVSLLRLRGKADIGQRLPTNHDLRVRALLVPRGVIASQQSILAASRDIDLMEAASLRAMRDAITATQAFEMQNKHPRILKITGELVLRPWGGAHMP